MSFWTSLIVFPVLMVAIIYLGVGVFLSEDEFVPWRRVTYIFFWGILPLFAEWSFQYAEKTKKKPIEANCACSRRLHQDAGGKYCSVCGGVIKDKLWKRSKRK